MSAVPVTRERVVATPRYRVVTRRKPSAIAAVATRCLAFTVIAGAAYAASTLYGMVKMEQARNTARLATIKSASVSERSRILKSEVDALKDFGAVERWALSNGFIAPGATEPADTLAHAPEAGGAPNQ